MPETDNAHAVFVMIEFPEGVPMPVTDVLSHDDEGNPEVLQVEEPSGQQRMYFPGVG